MKENLKKEFLITFQFFSILLISIIVSFVMWIAEFAIEGGGHINIGLVWKDLQPFYLRLIFCFIVFISIRLFFIHLFNRFRRFPK
jgi:magnesium-transporting ATPase (P-type)